MDHFSRNLQYIFFFNQFSARMAAPPPPPREDAWECVEDTSSVSPACRKRRLNGVMCRNHRIKRVDKLGYCLKPYQRLWLYNGAPLVAFYDTLGIRRTYSRLKPPASSRGYKKGGRTDTLKNPTKCLWRWEPDRRCNFFSPRTHLCRHIYG